MVISKNRNNSGRKKEFGKLDFETGSMKVFVGYHTCDSETAKILLDLDQVRDLTNRYGRTKDTKLRRLLSKSFN